MMSYASKQAGILAPRVLGCYDVEPEVIVTVTDLIRGESLDKVWHTMDKSQRNSIKAQLKDQLRLFRTCTQPYIGRINRQPTLNFYDRLDFNFMGPFDSEEDFDNWCLARVKSSIILWKRLLPKMRGKNGERNFVLTHGDLAARNIMVNDGKGYGDRGLGVQRVLSGIYGVCTSNRDNDCQEDWWKPVLKEILEPCGFQRSRFSAAIKNRGW
ncbi:hypothetical protein AJ79_00120 [Helicocarpus griseus UAMH5409]|uniref:non-specific serine/threonine protein kinase n=1 Tax=Helicocarpus griseus UAMH5409 TaxID=1447875 RepID=A0A2B7YC24_9EURO|nr:hypothetical protein AJ79_00120 [Helicocarpus griseus UAMH5409]